VKNVK